MAPTVGSEGGYERAEMASFRAGGLALLPWTKQMLTVLWGQLRLLLQVIYYTFMSVFQMFRFEVHVRITDETGQHIQHMSATSSPSDSFLFSTLFDGDSSVMVAGSGHIPDFCGEMSDPFAGRSTAEALLSSLRAEEICCGLVDELVSRTSRKEDMMFGAQGSWEVGFSSDWSVFGSCPGEPPEEEEQSCSPWSSEEDQNPFEFDNEESQKLWESLSGSSDPYNPFFFSASTSTRADKQKQEAAEPRDGGDRSSEEVPVPGVNVLVSRSDSEISWSGSDGSDGCTLSEEAEQLLQLFSSSDPYDPMCFTACSSTCSLPAPPPTDPSLPPPASPSSSSSEEEEEQLWKALGRRQDPYHPLNFQDCLRSASAEQTRQRPPRVGKPSLQKRPSTHWHPQTSRVPWTRPRKSDKTKERPDPVHKKVRFSPVVHVHVMRSWAFARQASRKGNWEAMARDRERFRRRIQEAESSIGPCLSPAHRGKVREYLDSALTELTDRH